MSKRHSYSSGRSSEDDQYDASDVDATAEGDATSDGDDDFPKAPSLLGREAKIGLAVVLLLLIVLGAVLARRLASPSGEAAKKAPAAASDKEQKPSETGSSAATAPTPASRKPTILEPRPGPSRQAPTSDVGHWAVAADRPGAPKGVEGGRAGSTPSYMPGRTSSTAGPGQYDPYAPARPAPRMGSAWPAGEATTSDATSPGRGYDPLGSRSTPAHSGGTPGTYGQGAVSAPAYTPAASVNPARTGSPLDSGVPAGPGADNPLRGHSGTSISVDPAGSSPRDAGATSVPDAYRPGSYGTGATSTYGATQPPQTTVPGSAASGQFGTASASPAYGAPSDPLPSRYTSSGQRRPDGTYVVQPGDNYWTISERLYGTGAYFKALVEHNRDRVRQPDRLAVGDVIAAPTKEQLEQTYPDLCPKPAHVDAARRQATSLASGPAQYGSGRVYVVREGDTLWDIAKYELGKPARWLEIYELNRDVLGEDLDHLRPGTRLSLPGGDSSDTVTRRPGAAYQR